MILRNLSFFVIQIGDDSVLLIQKVLLLHVCFMNFVEIVCIVDLRI